MNLGPKFAEALTLGNEAHATQLRKGTTIPYIAHLLSVAAIVIEAGGDEDAAIAALLHDAVEDQGGAPMLEQIRDHFGAEVADIVDACSDTLVTPKPPWRERKEAYVAAIAHKSESPFGHIAPCPLQSPDAMHAPKPDRSDALPNLAKTDENPVLDLGWTEGFLSDARPYRIEAWAEDQVSSITVFMSTNGIENYSNAQFADLLEREQLIAYHPGGRRSAYAMPCTDASGNSLWSVNVVTGDDEETFVDVLADIRPYANGLPSASLHTAPNADAAWTKLACAIASCLAELQEDEFLITSYKRANYFVQFAANGGFGMRAEASCNSFIEPEASLIDDQYAAMAGLGWQRATELLAESGASADPNGSPNFFVDVATPVNYAALGQLAVATFRTVYGVAHPGDLQYSSLGENGLSIRFPSRRSR